MNIQAITIDTGELVEALRHLVQKRLGVLPETIHIESHNRVIMTIDELSHQRPVICVPASDGTRHRAPESTT